MYKIIIICISCLLLVSCTGKKARDNSDLIPKDILSHMLLDIHMIDGTLNSHNNHEREKIFVSKGYYDSVVFKHYAYSQEMFEQSIREYTMQGEMKEVYTFVIDSLNTLKVTLEQTRQRSINATKQRKTENKAEQKK